MHIVFVIYGSIDQVTGGYLYDRKVVEWLRARGDRVEVLSLPKRPPLLAPIRGPGCSLRVLLRGVTRKAEDRTWIVVDELTYPSFFTALLFHPGSIECMATLVHHLRSDERIGAVQRWLALMCEKVLLNRSGLIIVNSDTTASAVRRHLKTGVRVQVCRPGKNTLPAAAQRSAAQWEGAETDHTVQLLTVGNVIPRKGHMALAAYLAPMTDLSWQLTIVGRDEPRTVYSKRLHALIDRSGLGQRVHFAGTVSDEELALLYRYADLFLFPSSYEGYGIALAEALCYGLPYVAFNSGGLREIAGCGGESAEMKDRVIPCRGGYLVDIGNPDIFGAVLRRLIEDAGLRSRLSREALERSWELPTWEETGACFRAALNDSEREEASLEEKGRSG